VFACVFIALIFSCFLFVFITAVFMLFCWLKFAFVINKDFCTQILFFSLIIWCNQSWKHYTRPSLYINNSIYNSIFIINIPYILSFTVYCIQLYDGSPHNCPQWIRCLIVLCPFCLYVWCLKRNKGVFYTGLTF